MSAALAALERVLASAERRIALLDRCRAPGFGAERARVVAAWEAGREAKPRWDLVPSPQLAPLERGLGELATTVVAAGPWGELYAARAAELALEARIASQLGSPAARAAAAARFPLPVGVAGAGAAARAAAWAQLPVESGAEPTEPSDDERSPSSLVSRLRAELGRRRLPVRVELCRELFSTVAVGDEVVRLRAGVALTAGDVDRLLAHELEGHLLPRWRAQDEPLGLFRIGTAEGSDDEEGRALALELSRGGSANRRRRELAWRHLAAVALRDGADFVELTRLLRTQGAAVAEAVALALRVDRGVGLGRELVYLPALVRFQAARRRGPDPEPWLRRGRIAVAAVPRLLALGAPPERLALGTRGAFGGRGMGEGAVFGP